MFGIFNDNNKIRDVAHVLFSRIVEQSRNPKFYTDWKVADTLDGRFDLIILHLSLVINRLEKSDGNKKILLLIRYLQEVLFDNMDMSLRELGVGDMSVGKKVKIMAEAFYGRKAAYQKAINSDHRADQFSLSLIKNIYRENEPEKNILDHFADYIVLQINTLENYTDDDLTSGKLVFADFRAE